MMENSHTTDRFGHRVPTREEIEGDSEDDNRPQDARDPVEEQMEIRAAQFHGGHF